MARSPDEIRDSMAESVRDIDPTADLDKGPIFDFLIAPVAPELSQTETQVEELRQLVSLQIDQITTPEEVNSIGIAFGIAPLSGKNSTCRQTFFTFTQPTSDVIINRGTLVSTNDQSLIFVVDEQITMRADIPNVYFNASRRRYEITARVVASASGEDYDLPAFRINRLITNISGIDGTENRENSSGGVLQQSTEDYFSRIRAKFLGLNPETGGGIRSSILEFSPEIVTDVSLVYPKDREIFFRDISRPAIDAYVIGTETDTATQVYVATGGETSVLLETVPVLTVDSVIVNSVTLSATAYALVNDTSLPTKDSARAVDSLVLATPLVANDAVTVTYTYNKLIRDLQDQVFNIQTRQFETDILVREPAEIPVTVHVDVTILPSFDAARVTDAVRQLTFNYLQLVIFSDDRLPEVFRQSILTQVPGVSSVNLIKFTPTGSSLLDIEVIRLKKNELTTVDQANLVIRVRQ